MKRFEIGQKYTTYGLFTGCQTFRTVKDRIESPKGTKIIFKDCWIAEDTLEDVFDESTYDVIELEDSEAIVLWEYMGEKGYLFAR